MRVKHTGGRVYAGLRYIYRQVSRYKREDMRNIEPYLGPHHQHIFPEWKETQSLQWLALARIFLETKNVPHNAPLTSELKKHLFGPQWTIYLLSYCFYLQILFAMRRLRMALELGVAEAVRFELTKDSRPCRFSRPVHSTALPRFRDIIIHYFVKLHQAKITKSISFI